MNASRSDRLYEIGREAGEKYDYFMAGLAAALTAYLGENFNPSRASWLVADVLEALAILILIASVAAGIKRIAIANRLLRVSHAKIGHMERIEVLQKGLAEPEGVIRIPGLANLQPGVAEQLLSKSERMRSESQDLQEKLMKHVMMSGHLRDRFLLSGFLVLLVARLIGALQ